MGKGASQNTMGPTYGGPPGPPVNYNSLNYGGGSGLMRPTPTGSGKGGMTPAGGGFMGGSFGRPPQFQTTGKGGGLQTQGDLGPNMTPPPPTGLFSPPTATIATPQPTTVGQQFASLADGAQLQSKKLTDAASIAGRPVNSFAEADAILAGRFAPTSGAGGMRLNPDGYPTRAEIEKITGMAIRPGDRQGEINRYNRFMQNQGQTTQTSNMFGTTKARTPAEQALLTQRQAEIDARVAQQNELAAQQEEYDKMFGGLTEEQQAFFGNQLQSPQAQQDQAYADFLRNQLGSNRFNQNFLSNILRNRVPPRTPYAQMRQPFRPMVGGPFIAELQGT